MTASQPNDSKGNAATRGEVRSAKIMLCGESVQLRTDQPAEALERLAGYVNDKARAVGAGDAPSPENFRLLALAALGIAGELFEAKAKLEEQEQNDRSLVAKAKSLNDSLDRALARKG
ncbi:MAG TPA: cell division protein ZapA [Fibrobacteria bacterium]|jgi:cell division protein ZapA (FtsZ GTPase activity inhibitor)|nr:cell division protein ZapA [Fibrobacteria bacterium]